MIKKCSVKGEEGRKRKVENRAGRQAGRQAGRWAGRQHTSSPEWSAAMASAPLPPSSRGPHSIPAGRVSVWK